MEFLLRKPSSRDTVTKIASCSNIFHFLLNIFPSSKFLLEFHRVAEKLNSIYRSAFEENLLKMKTDVGAQSRCEKYWNENAYKHCETWKKAVVHCQKLETWKLFKFQHFPSFPSVPTERLVRISAQFNWEWNLCHQFYKYVLRNEKVFLYSTITTVFGVSENFR